jgi:rSAM/selenodomain-associated transferase 1
MQYHYPAGRILVFTKAPIAGQVKTRLQSALGTEQCALLQQRLIQHCLQSAVDSRLCPVQLHADRTDHPFLQDCAKRYAVPLHPQTGANLGQRMQHALAHVLSDASLNFALIIGSDCALLTAGPLQRACHALQKQKVVFIPASDGGYVLIGSRNPVPAIFGDIDWGGAEVMLQTRQRLQQMGWQWAELESLWDIDRPEDFARLCTLPEYRHCWQGIEQLSP